MSIQSLVSNCSLNTLPATPSPGAKSFNFQRSNTLGPFILLPAHALHSRIGGRLWGSRHDLHQFDWIPIRIIDPVLQIGIHPPDRRSTDLKTSCCQLTEGSRQVINK